MMTRRIQNILRGMGSVVDLWPAKRDRYAKAHPYRTDADALRHDWERIGGDMYKAFNQVREQEIKE